jgi:hypothetical protein
MIDDGFDQVVVKVMALDELPHLLIHSRVLVIHVFEEGLEEIFGYIFGVPALVIFDIAICPALFENESLIGFLTLFRAEVDTFVYAGIVDGVYDGLVLFFQRADDPFGLKIILVLKNKSFDTVPYLGCFVQTVSFFFAKYIINF